MKKLSLKEYEAAPEEIKWLYNMVYIRQPIGYSRYVELQEKYPEYFLKNKKK